MAATESKAGGDDEVRTFVIFCNYSNEKIILNSVELFVFSSCCCRRIRHSRHHLSEVWGPLMSRTGVRFNTGSGHSRLLNLDS